ncbi:hypothetical protein LQ567_19250 [Niabella pedocola]|uniref:Uncharacterized protein n=1 Tax=Niabella pedocola TaxID=1752077 RepID=A0ABS8PV32_9BACT|nr:hypothetical protein [Niabella pedocola]MCD2424929.1 hypothetical protein [Niabella pedocola]
MIEKYAHIWSRLNGGYKIPYNAAMPLNLLQKATDERSAELVFDELWDNLHHQGDVGEASYYALPCLVQTGMEQQWLHWKFIGLCLVIDHCRRAPHNPPLPLELEPDYIGALQQLEKYLLSHFQYITDPVAFRLTLAFFATQHGQADLGKTIEYLDDDVLEEVQEHYGL